MRVTRHILLLLSLAALLLPALVVGASTSTAAGTHSTATSLSVSPDNHPVYGETSTFSGEVVYAPSTGTQTNVPGGPVTLERRLRGSSTWKDFRSRTVSSADGSYSFHVTAKRNAAYRVTYDGRSDGTDTYSPSTSRTVKVWVSRNLNDRKTHPHPGKFRLVGNVDPGWNHKRIKLFRRTCETCTWKVYDRQRTTGKGKFNFPLTLPKRPGAWHYRVKVPASTRYVATFSAVYVAQTRASSAGG